MSVLTGARPRQTAAKPESQWRFYPIGKTDKSTRRRLNAQLCRTQGITHVQFVRGGMKVFYRGLQYTEVAALVDAALAL